MSVRILIGDALDRLAELPDDSVHCVVTSPPYWGLRDYGVAGQIGLEADFGDYIAILVDVFRGVRRVMRPDGTLWLNLGDSYANATGAQGLRVTAASDDPSWRGRDLRNQPKRRQLQSDLRGVGLKPKDLCGIPWRVAFALQEDGWWLRQDIIWSKPNPMPESVTDRCTKAHEYLFLLTKSVRYWFDAAAIKEDAVSDHGAGNDFSSYHSRIIANSPLTGGTAAKEPWNDIGGKRNRRSVWTITTNPFPEAHFATFPPALCEPCILAGCPEGGTVLDPFGGAGTTGLVADRLGRNAILIELNPEYAAMAERRCADDAGLFSSVEAAE